MARFVVVVVGGDGVSDGVTRLPGWLGEVAGQSRLLREGLTVEEAFERFRLPVLPFGRGERWGLSGSQRVPSPWGCAGAGWQVPVQPPKAVVDLVDPGREVLLWSLSAFQMVDVVAQLVGSLGYEQVVEVMSWLPPPSSMVPSPGDLGSVSVHGVWVQRAGEVRWRFWDQVHGRAHRLASAPASGRAARSGLLPESLAVWSSWVATRLELVDEPLLGESGVLDVVAFPLLPSAGSLFDNWLTTRPVPHLHAAPLLEGDREFLEAVEVSGLVLSADRVWVAALPPRFSQCLQWLAPAPSRDLGCVPQEVAFARLPEVLRNAAALSASGVAGPLVELAWSLDR